MPSLPDFALDKLEKDFRDSCCELEETVVKSGLGGSPKRGRKQILGLDMD
jgi:hypothetical protein